MSKISKILRTSYVHGPKLKRASDTAAFVKARQSDESIVPHVELTVWKCHVRVPLCEIRSDGMPGAKKELLKNCFVCQAVCVTLILLFDLN